MQLSQCLHSSFSWIMTILPFINLYLSSIFLPFFCWSQVCVEVGVKTFSFWISHFPVVRLRRLRRRPFDQKLFIRSVCARVVFVLLAPLCTFHLLLFFFVAVFFFFTFCAVCAHTRPHALLSVTPAFNHQSGPTPRTDGRTDGSAVPLCGRRPSQSRFPR